MSVLEGSYLFQQDDEVDSLFFLLSGYILLSNGDGSRETIVSYAGPDEVLGEQILYGAPRTKRAYSARAHTDVNCIRLNAQEISDLKLNHKDLYIELLQICGASCFQRLAKANQLIHCFKYDNKADKLMHLMVYFINIFSRKTDKGPEVFLPPDLFKFYINISQSDFETCISELKNSGILSPTIKDHYLLTDKTQLLQKLPKIIDQIPTFPII